MTDDRPCPQCGRRRVCPQCRRAGLHVVADVVSEAPSVPAAPLDSAPAPAVADGVGRYLAAVATVAELEPATVDQEAPAVVDTSTSALVPMHDAVGNGTVEPTPVPMENDPTELVAAYHAAHARMAEILVEQARQADIKAEVVRQLTMGRSKVEVAALLGISRVSVHKHLARGVGE